VTPKRHAGKLATGLGVPSTQKGGPIEGIGSKSRQKGGPATTQRIYRYPCKGHSKIRNSLDPSAVAFDAAVLRRSTQTDGG